MSAFGGAVPALGANLSGTWKCCGDGDAADQNFVINDSGGTLTGSAILPAGTVFADITGSATETTVTIVTTYNSFAPGYVATFTGTFSTDQKTLSGNWRSNRGQAGSWSATRDTKRPSAVRVTCNRGPDLASPALCTASVGDGGPTPPVTPTGTVSFATNDGALSPARCTLVATAASPGVASCASTYSRPAGVPAGVALPVTATYLGDATFSSSSAQHQLTTAVADPDGPPVLSCFMGWTGAQAQERVRRSFETEERRCAAEKVKRRDLYNATSTGMNLTAGLASGSSLALRHYKNRIVGRLIQAQAKRAVARQVAGLAGGPPGEFIATASNIYNAVVLYSDVSAVTATVASGSVSMVALFDPPDPKYRETARVARVLPTRLLTPPRWIAPRLRTRMQAYLTAEGRLAALDAAFITALNRAGNAQKAGEQEVVKAQLTAASGFATEIAGLIERRPALARRALGPLQPLARLAWSDAITVGMRRQVATRAARTPLASGGLAIIRRAGAPVGQIVSRARKSRVSVAGLAADPITLALRQSTARAKQAGAMRLLAKQLAAG